MLDTVIIGAGPAGLSAAVYARRAGLNALLIEDSPVYGGQVLSTYEVDNYLGLPGVSGIELSEKFSSHAKSAGIDTVSDRVVKIEKNGEFKKVVCESDSYDTKTVIVATGALHAHLNVPGEEELAGMGVSYCATCDGAFFKDCDVCVIGGSDVAVEDAIYLSRTCRHVFLIHRRDSLRAAQSLINVLAKCANVSFLWDSEVVSFNGEEELTSVTIHNKKTEVDSTIDVQGAFVAVGIKPMTDFLGLMVEKDAGGYIVAGEDCRTSERGIYVAGDIRRKPMRQIITAVADGANAASSVSEDIRG